jgi:hypothetical protein
MGVAYLDKMEREVSGGWIFRCREWCFIAGFAHNCSYEDI